MFYTRLFVVLCLSASLAACAQTISKKAEHAEVQFTTPSKRVLIVDPDVTLGELTAGGVVETRADWSATAKQLLVKEVAATLWAKNIDVAVHDKVQSEREAQLIKLYSAAGEAALSSVMISLPTKGKHLDWTLGPGTNVLRDRYDADYAMFMFVHDTYSSTGRAFMMLGAAMMGVGIQGGQQIGYTSLVDLRTGKMIWFNFLTSASGDLRDEKSAKPVVKNLLTDLPL